MTRDRRNYPRYRLNEGVLVTRRHVLGPILNLGMGGMCFEYFEGEQLDHGPMDLGIFSDRTRLLLSGIRATTVYDIVLEQGEGFLPLRRKRRAIRFLDLTPAQQQAIRQLLTTHTMGPA
ncbi:hypothetical protein ACLG6S_09315 [Thermodesulfobacteriota bacterium B35]